MAASDRDGASRKAQKRMSSISYSSSSRDAHSSLASPNGVLRSPALERLNPLGISIPSVYEEARYELEVPAKRNSGTSSTETSDNEQAMGQSANGKASAALTLAEK